MPPVVDAFFAAWNRNDVAALVSLLSDDVVVSADSAWPRSGIFEGHAAAADFYREFFAEFQTTSTFEPDSVVVDGDYVSLRSRIVGEDRGSGLAADWDYEVMLRLEGDRIASVAYFLDVDDAIAAATTIF